MEDSGLRLQPGTGFHLDPTGQWRPEAIPPDVLDDAVVSGHLTIDGYRCTVFETSDKESWAQKGPGTVASAFSEEPEIMSTVASRVAARWLEAKGKKRDITSIVDKIMERPGDDQKYEKEIAAFAKRVRKAIPNVEKAFEGLAADLAKATKGLGEAGHDKVTSHHADVIREQFSKSVSTVQVAATSLIRNLQKKCDEWDPDGKE